MDGSREMEETYGDVLGPLTKLGLSDSATVNVGLWQQIKEDWDAHGLDWTRPGSRAVAVQLFSIWRMTIQPKLLKAHW